MCLSLEALVLFLNLLDPAIVSTKPDVVTVHATQGAVDWTRAGDLWCLPADARAPADPRVFTAPVPLGAPL